jgi:hypothetical protein
MLKMCIGDRDRYTAEFAHHKTREIDMARMKTFRRKRMTSSASSIYVGLRPDSGGPRG